MGFWDWYSGIEKKEKIVLCRDPVKRSENGCFRIIGRYDTANIRTRETRAINILADLAREALSADFYVGVAGLIRSDRDDSKEMEEANVLHLYTEDPFKDKMFKFELTREDLVLVMNHWIHRGNVDSSQNANYPVLSGMRVQAMSFYGLAQLLRVVPTSSEQELIRFLLLTWDLIVAIVAADFDIDRDGTKTAGAAENLRCSLPWKQNYFTLVDDAMNLPAGVQGAHKTRLEEIQRDLLGSKCSHKTKKADDYLEEVPMRPIVVIRITNVGNTHFVGREIASNQEAKRFQRRLRPHEVLFCFPGTEILGCQEDPARKKFYTIGITNAHGLNEVSVMKLFARRALRNFRDANHELLDSSERLDHNFSRRRDSGKRKLEMAEKLATIQDLYLAKNDRPPMGYWVPNHLPDLPTLWYMRIRGWTVEDRFFFPGDPPAFTLGPPLFVTVGMEPGTNEHNLKLDQLRLFECAWNVHVTTAGTNYECFPRRPFRFNDVGTVTEDTE